jgi:hypothetical protein
MSRKKIYTPAIREKIGCIVKFVKTKRNIKSGSLVVATALHSAEVSAVECGMPKMSRRNTALVLGVLGIDYAYAIAPGCYALLVADADLYAKIKDAMGIPDPVIKLVCFVFDAYISILPTECVDLVQTAGKGDYPSCIIRLLNNLTEEELDGVFACFLSSGVSQRASLAQAMGRAELQVYLEALLESKSDPFRVLCEYNNVKIPDYFGLINDFNELVSELRFVGIGDTEHIEHIVQGCQDKTDKFRTDVSAIQRIVNRPSVS